MPAHTPECLEKLAVEKFVYMVLQHSIPSSLQNILLPQDDEVWIPYDHCKLDKIIMTPKNTWSELRAERMLFMEHLQKLKQWWDDNEWLGKQKSEIRRQIRECFTRELELVDPQCRFPLFRFLLQLIFSTKVGGTADAQEVPHYPKVQLELRRNDCPVYSDILRSLKPFGIEELSTQHIIFGDSEPWIIIIENSPFLRKVHFRKNICEEILFSVGQHCPLIDTFIVEQFYGRLMVPVDCFYKTFFSGLGYEAVDSIAKSENSLDKLKYLSFPRLKSVDIGDRCDSQKVVKKQSLTEFLYNLLFFYPDVVCVSCHTLKPFLPKIPSSLPEHCSSLSYNIRHVDLTGLMPWVQQQLTRNSEHCDERIDFESVVSSFKQLQHLTICHCVDTHTNVESIKENTNFAEIWIPKFGCKNLTLHVPHTTSQEISNFEILSLYIPLFKSVGCSLCALHFHVHVGIDLSEVCQLICLCPNLELLGIRLLAEVNVCSEALFHVQRLPRLTSLSVACAASPGASIVNTLVQKIIAASPILTNLELMLAYRPYEWLMGMAVDKTLAKIRTLRLSFTVHCVNEWAPDLPMAGVDVSFYVPLVELLPNLEMLMLGILPIEVFSQIKLIYRTSNLKIVARSKPYIGYAVLSTM